MEKVFIEEQFPVSKISKECYKERTSGGSQLLTGLGRWWGRKPLTLVRSVLLAVLFPKSSDPKKDLLIFNKCLQIDDNGLQRRRTKSLSAELIYKHLAEAEHFDIEDEKVRWKRGTSASVKEELSQKIFKLLSYDEKLSYCDRIDSMSSKVEDWKEINSHLGTSSSSFQDLIMELGKRSYGEEFSVGDCFSGGGSIPFEVACSGAPVFSSDLSPVASLLSWSSLNIVGGNDNVKKIVSEVQTESFEKAQSFFKTKKWEQNDEGYEIESMLYCVEVKLPSGLMVPVSPSWVVSQKYKVCGKLVHNKAQNNFDIEIITGASDEEMKKAAEGTLKNGRVTCPITDESFSISSLRGDRKQDGVSISGLRAWGLDDFTPSDSDIFQERLFCIIWSENLSSRTSQRKFAAPTKSDLEKEDEILEFLKSKSTEWREMGVLPVASIEEGYNTSQPIRERGWKYWQNMYTPRQLVMHALYLENIKSYEGEFEQVAIASGLLGIGAAIDYQSKLCGWNPHKSKGPGSSRNVFFNQALNTQYMYASRSFGKIKDFYLTKFESCNISTPVNVENQDAREIKHKCSVWITDPPYADAINYHELGDFFLSWYGRTLSSIFPSWSSSSRKILTVQGSGKEFKQSMIDVYSNLRQNMPDNGIQVVMFTHQDASVWADLAMILWAAGLKVTAAWTIATETSSTGIKEGNYVQGTVLLVLRKRVDEESAFLDEMYPEIEDEVKAQLDSMLSIDDKDNPNFGDTDYQLAAYAAALRVLTKYSDIDGQDIKHELFREKASGEFTEFEKVINRAVEISCDHLVPDGFDNFCWKGLTADERLYLKGLELEKHMEARAGAYQELAKGFGVKDYSLMYASSKANFVRFKSPSEFKKGALGGQGFGSSLVRNVLFAIYESARNENVKSGLTWLRNEVGDYWNNRKSIAEILKYLSSFNSYEHMSHWAVGSSYAKTLEGAVHNDHEGNRL